MADIAIGPAGAEKVQAGSTTGTLKRSLGLSSVVVFTVASVSLAYGGAFPYSSATGVWPGANLFGVITVAVGIGLLFAYVYSAMGAAVPHFGADYLVASRVLPPPLAFASSWSMVLFLGLLGGSLIASIPSQWLPTGLRLLSTITGREEILLPIAWLTSSSGIATLGSVAVVVLFLLMVLPPRVTQRVLLVGVILAVLAWGVIYFQFGMANAAQFPEKWDGIYGEGSFLDHLLRARQGGLMMDYSMNRTLMAGLTLGLWIVFGHTNVVMFSREVRSPEKNLLRGISLGLLIIWLVLGIGALLIQRVIPLEWLAAESMLYQSGVTEALPFVLVYGAVLNPNPILTGLVSIAWIFSVLNMAHTVLYTANSELVAWAEDLVIPKEVAFIHPVLNSPLIALLLVCILAVIGVIDTSLHGDLLMRYNPLYIMAFVLIIPTLGITLMPFLRRDMFENAPGFVRAKIGPLPLITLAGLVALVYLGWSVWMNASLRNFGGIGAPTITMFGLMFGSGIIWFIGRMALLHSRKEDISKLFKGIPRTDL